MTDLTFVNCMLIPEGMPLQLDLLGASSAFYMGRVMLIFSFFFQMRDESKKQYPHIQCTHVELQNMEF